MPWSPPGGTTHSRPETYLPIPSTDHAIFRSLRYPHGRRGLAVFHQALGTPLSSTLLAICIYALSLALQELPVKRFLTYSIPVALIGSAIWARWFIGRTIVELQLNEQEARVISLWHVAVGRLPAWQTVLDLHQDDQAVRVVIGDATYELARNDWPEFKRLSGALQAARWQPE